MKRALVTSIAVLSITLGVAGSVATVGDARSRGDNNHNDKHECEDGRSRKPTEDACKDKDKDKDKDDKDKGDGHG